MRSRFICAALLERVAHLAAAFVVERGRAEIARARGGSAMAMSATMRPGRGLMTMTREDEVDALVDRVGDEDDGQFLRRPQLAQFVVQTLAREFVERGERLVHQQHRRLGRERAGDRDAHLHAARQLARIGLREGGEADEVERFLRARADERFVVPFELERQADVLLDAWPTASAPHPGRRSRAAVCVPGHLIAPLVRRREAGDEAQQRALAAAGRPDDARRTHPARRRRRRRRARGRRSESAWRRVEGEKQGARYCPSPFGGRWRGQRCATDEGSDVAIPIRLAPPPAPSPDGRAGMAASRRQCVVLLTGGFATPRPLSTKARV